MTIVAGCRMMNAARNEVIVDSPMTIPTLNPAFRRLVPGDRTSRSSQFSECLARMSHLDPNSEKARSLRGELYYAFGPEFVRDRRRCELACDRFNNAGDVPRRRLVELWRESGIVLA